MPILETHPTAQIGQEIMLDRVTGIVIRETTAIEDETAILHTVTLDGKGVIINTGSIVLEYCLIRYGGHGYSYEMHRISIAIKSNTKAWNETLDENNISGTAQPVCPECKTNGIEHIISTRSVQNSRNSDPWFFVIHCDRCGHVYNVIAKHVFSQVDTRFVLPKLDKRQI